MNLLTNIKAIKDLYLIFIDNNLLLVVSYLKAKAKVAWELEAIDVEHWYNTSGYCRLLIAELKQTTKNE